MPTGDMTLQSEDERDVLRLELCPGCGYALQGLPMCGTCPECGRDYDDQTVVLFGWAEGSHRTGSNGSRFAFGLMLFVGGFQVLNALFNFRGFGIRGRVLGFVVAGIWVWTIASICWRRWTADMPGLVQVHLSDAGCRQLDNPEDAKQPAFAAWSGINDVMLGQKSTGLWRLRLRHKGPWWRWPRTPVDAVVRCTAEQGWALRERITSWRSVS